MRTIKNTKIVSTFLGIEDHGIPTFMINLDFGGARQGYGRYDLRYYGIEIILEILKVLEVDSWENLSGVIRADSDHDKIYKIGHIIKNQWFDVEDLKKKRKRYEEKRHEDFNDID